MTLGIATAVSAILGAIWVLVSLLPVWLLRAALIAVVGLHPIHWPDGCSHRPAIAPPSTPIPPPCIQEAYTEPDLESYETPTIRLVVAVAHPEYGPGLVDHVYFVREPLTGTAQLPVWHFEPRHDWDAACGKDEGPLAWAAGRLLAGDLTALSAYTGPLPPDFLDLLADLGGWRLYRVYLPLIVTSQRNR